MISFLFARRGGRAVAEDFNQTDVVGHAQDAVLAVLTGDAGDFASAVKIENGRAECGLDVAAHLGRERLGGGLDRVRAHGRQAAAFDELRDEVQRAGVATDGTGLPHDQFLDKALDLFLTAVEDVQPFSLAGMVGGKSRSAPQMRASLSSLTAPSQRRKRSLAASTQSCARGSR